jgi:hypothetical protein
MTSINTRLVLECLPIPSTQAVSSTRPPKDESTPPWPSNGKAKQQPWVAPKPIKRPEQRVVIDMANRKPPKPSLVQRTQASSSHLPSSEPRQPCLVVSKPVSSIRPATVKRPNLKVIVNGDTTSITARSRIAPKPANDEVERSCSVLTTRELSQNSSSAKAQPTKKPEPHSQAMGNIGYSAECPEDSSERPFEWPRTSQWLANEQGQASILPGGMGEE